MKKTLLKFAGIAALAFAVSSTASAALISGAVTFGGGATLNTGDANTATAVTAWNSAFVISKSGSFDIPAVSGAVALVAPWSFNSGAVANFWQVGGFSFDLTSSWIVAQTGNGSVTVNGVGKINGYDYEETDGTWSFTTQNPSAGGVFSFSASGAAVPDGGTTAALLGAALVGMSLLARRRAA
jgi:hypothetical protein